MSLPPAPPLAGSALNLTGQVPTLAREDGVWFVAAGHDAAEALARELRSQHRETSWWPLLTSELDVEEIWDAALDADLAVGLPGIQQVEADADIEELLADWVGDLVLPTQVRPKPAGSGPLDLLGSLEWTGVLLVPCRRPWESLPFLGFGGFNDCPDPADQGAVARWLYDEHGSDPIAVGADSLVFRSLRPVGPDRLVSAVRTLLCYCPALTDQDVDPDQLAGLLAAGVTRLGLWWE